MLVNDSEEHLQEEILEISGVSVFTSVAKDTMAFRNLYKLSLSLALFLPSFLLFILHSFSLYTPFSLSSLSLSIVLSLSFRQVCLSPLYLFLVPSFSLSLIPFLFLISFAFSFCYLSFFAFFVTPHLSLSLVSLSLLPSIIIPCSLFIFP